MSAQPQPRHRPQSCTHGFTRSHTREQLFSSVSTRREQHRRALPLCLPAPPSITGNVGPWSTSTHTRSEHLHGVLEFSVFIYSSTSGQERPGPAASGPAQRSKMRGGGWGRAATLPRAGSQGLCWEAAGTSRKGLRTAVTGHRGSLETGDGVRFRCPF